MNARIRLCFGFIKLVFVLEHLKTEGIGGVIIEFPDKNRPHLLLATATGATARKAFSYDVILFGVPCYWLLQVLQVLQLARRLAMTSFFLEYLATGCYRCYSSQGVHL